MLSYELTNKEYQPAPSIIACAIVVECFHMNLQIRNINFLRLLVLNLYFPVLSYELTNKEYQQRLYLQRYGLDERVLSYEFTNKEYQQHRIHFQKFPFLLVLSYELTNKEYQLSIEYGHSSHSIVLSYELTNKEYQRFVRQDI